MKNLALSSSLFANVCRIIGVCFERECRCEVKIDVDPQILFYFSNLILG